MRKVVSGLFISLDGVAESPGEWQFDFDDEMGAALDEQISAADTILMGRVTYEEWANYWPNATTDEDFARFINETPKLIASTTLSEAPWGDYDNATVIDNVDEEITRLKAQPGGTILVTGSPTLVESLLYAELLDELQLLVHPVVVGKGRQLFNEGHALKRMTLVSAKATPSGVAILTYRPFEG